MTDNDDPRIRRNHRAEWTRLDRGWRRAVKAEVLGGKTT